MAINFDKAFGMHPESLALRSKQAEVVAGNIANADTPGYKAKGMDFQAMLTQAANKQQTGMSRTHEKHLDVSIPSSNGLEFRIPNQPDTGDGNTVDVQLERNLYLDNSMRYQASLQFLTGKIQGMKKAITGAQ